MGLEISANCDGSLNNSEHSGDFSEFHARQFSVMKLDGATKKKGIFGKLHMRVKFTLLPESENFFPIHHGQKKKKKGGKVGN